MHDTVSRLFPSDFPKIKRGIINSLQVNLGYLCNQTCLHCHVNAGPNRKELMDRESIDLLLNVVDLNKIKSIDLTGGAPELNPHFRYLVSELRMRDIKVIDRCNLTILSEPNQEDLAGFLADNKVDIYASLPCYTLETVDKQRGKGVFKRSIDGLRKLNRLGYGLENSELKINLVYNPEGPNLPPEQSQLEERYKQELNEIFDIKFNQLFAIANMPIQRFGSTLISRGQFDDYITDLRAAHQNENLDSVMCKQQLSVDWQGYLYDCDFNQMLDLPLQNSSSKRPHLTDLLGNNSTKNNITVGDHCYGCTAGQGSSCSGSLTQKTNESLFMEIT